MVESGAPPSMRYNSACFVTDEKACRAKRDRNSVERDKKGAAERNKAATVQRTNRQLQPFANSFRSSLLDRDAKALLAGFLACHGPI
jgi:hypothetical protein